MSAKIHHLKIHGTSHAAGWAIDDISNGSPGPGSVIPFAIVPGHRDEADEVCQAVNSWKHLRDALLAHARLPGDDITPPCWCPENYPANNEGRHSLTCSTSRIAIAKSKERP